MTELAISMKKQNSISPDERLKIAINYQHVGKLSTDSNLWRKFNGQFEIREMNIQGLAQAIHAGYAITVVHHRYRKRKNFVSAQHIGLDFDTEDDNSTIETLCLEPFIQQYAALIHTTSSHTVEHPRARVLFILDKPVIDADDYAEMCAALNDLYKTADENAKDPARAWFGAEGCEMIFMGKLLPLDVVEKEAVSPYRKKLAKRRNRAIARYRKSGHYELGQVPLKEIEQALTYIPAWGDYETWLRILMAVHSVYPGPEGIAICEGWSPGYEGEIEQKFKSFKSTGIRIGTLFHIANEHGYRPTERNSKIEMLRNEEGLQGDNPKGITGLVSADTILTNAWPEPVWVIPGCLPAGLGLVAGPPKIGKSWLELQIAQAVAAGGYVLGINVDKGPVLYLALEDPPRRLQERMKRQNWPLGLHVDFLTIGNFYDKVGDLRNGGSEKIAVEIEERGYRMVVIDTLSRAISGDQMDHHDMTMWLTPLQEMAHKTNSAVVIVDHHRKGTGLNPDAIADILGSTAKGAMADTVWGLYRERGKSESRLTVTGRDVEERTMALRFDSLTGCWQYEGDAYELEITERRQEILYALQDLGSASGTDIADSIGQPKSNTHARLQDLVAAGKVLRQKKGKSVIYRLPDHL